MHLPITEFTNTFPFWAMVFILIVGFLSRSKQIKKLVLSRLVGKHKDEE